MTVQPLDDRLRRSLYRGAGYDAFPFHAYDDYGMIVFPDEVHFPQELKQQLDDALTQPTWKRLYQALSVLNAPEWNCYSVGIRYFGGGIDVLIAKSIGTVADATAAARFHESVGNALLGTVAEAAGTTWMVDHQWISGLRAVLEALQKQLAPTGGTTPVEPGGGGGQPKRETGRALAPKAVDFAALSPVLAVDLLVSLAGFALQAVKPRSVSATILWYVPDTWGSEPTDLIIKNWRSVGRAQEFWGSARRVASCVWNPEDRAVAGWANDDHWLGSSPPMPLSPHMIQQFFYPAGRVV